MFCGFGVFSCVEVVLPDFLRQDLLVWDKSLQIPNKLLLELAYEFISARHKN